MSIEAKAVLTGTNNPLEIMNFLTNLDHVRRVSITPTYVKYDFVYINFDWFGEERSLRVFFNGNCMCDYKDIYPFASAYIVIGDWGFSEEIIMALVKEFGGYYDLNDCDDIGWQKYGEEI